MCLAIPGKIQSITEDDLGRCGVVDFEGISRSVNLTFVPEAGLGDYVLVHVGVAISCVDEKAAQTTLTMLKEMYVEGDPHATPE